MGFVTAYPEEVISTSSWNMYNISAVAKKVADI